MEIRQATIWTDEGDPLVVFDSPNGGQINVLDLSGSPIATIYDHGEEITVSLKPYQHHPATIEGLEWLLEEWGHYCSRGKGNGEQALDLIGRAITYSPQAGP
jgi:hypothetical protein